MVSQPPCYFKTLLLWNVSVINKVHAHTLMSSIKMTQFYFGVLQRPLVEGQLCWKRAMMNICFDE